MRIRHHIPDLFEVEEEALVKKVDRYFVQPFKVYWIPQTPWRS